MFRKLLIITTIAGAMSLTMGAANADNSFVMSAGEWGPINNSILVHRPARDDLGTPFPMTAKDD